MKRNLFLPATIIALAVATCGILYAADHVDSPTITNQPTDITDLYVFKGADANNLVFVANSQGLLSPGSSATAMFDANTVLEFNIDNNNDKVEDLVIQCKYDAASNKMKIYGPVTPSLAGTKSKLEGNVTAEVAVTAYGVGAPVVATGTTGIKVFAGTRDDPFFFDLTQYKKIIAGTASSFNNPGADSFAGTNVLSTVVEVPKSLLGGTGTINVWLETKKKI